MRKLKSILVLICVAVLVSAFTIACYKPDYSYKGNTPGVLRDPEVAWKNQDGTLNPAFRERYAALGRYQNPVRLKVAGIRYALESDVKDGTTLENQTFNRIAKDVLNIDLEYTIQATSTNYDQTLNLEIAAGNMPDMFYTNSANLFANLMENDRLADLTDAFWHLNDNLLENYITYMPEILPTVMRDSKLYALPMQENKYLSTQRLYVRQDWLDICGLEMPTTIEEFKAVAKAFKDNASTIASRTGVSATNILPFTMHKDMTVSNSYSAAGLFNAHGAKVGSFFKGTDGNLHASATSPEAKAALATINEMYSYGSLDPQFLSKTPETIISQINSGYVGMVFGEWWLPKDALDNCVSTVSGSHWSWGTLGEPIADRIFVTGYNLVSKTCSNPEAAAKLINLFYDIYYNDDAANIYKDKNTGIPLTLPSNGFYYQFVPIKLWDGISSLKEYDRVKNVFEGLYNAGFYKSERIQGGLYQTIPSAEMTSNDYRIGVASGGNINIINRSIVNEIKANEIWLELFNTMRNREKILHFADGYPYFIAYKQNIPIAQMAQPERRGWGIYHQMVDPKGTYGYIEELYNGKHSVKYNEFFGPPLSAMQEFNSILAQLVNVEYTKFINGQRPVSEFDSYFVSNYKSMGGNEVQSQVNEWWNHNKPQ